MGEKPKSGGRWGDYVALAIGMALIFYFTKVDREALARSDESWITAAIVAGGSLASIAAVTYLILRAWDALMARLRRRGGRQ